MNIALFRATKSFTWGRQERGMGGGEEFSSIARELKRRGHRVTLYGDVARSSVTAFREAGFRMRGPALELDRDEDCLVIDNGPVLNLLWSPGQLTLPRRMSQLYHLVKSCEATIFYSQSDPGPAMRPLTEVDAWLSIPSKRPVLEYVTVPPDPFAGKRLVVMVPQRWPEEFGPRLRNRYFDPVRRGVTFVHLDLSPLAMIDREILPPAGSPSRDIVYVGNARYRSRLGLYLNTPRAWIWGRWSDRARASLVPLANLVGRALADEVPGIYNSGRLTFVVKDDCELGYCARPTRLFEAVMGGCPVFVDEMTYRQGTDEHRYWPWVCAPGDVEGLLERVSDDRERLALLSDQRDAISSIDPLGPIDRLEEILEEYSR